MLVFDEGDVFSKVTYSEKGDPFWEMPKEYHSCGELEVSRFIQPSRRVNYSMVYAK